MPKLKKAETVAEESGTGGPWCVTHQRTRWACRVAGLDCPGTGGVAMPPGFWAAIMGRCGKAARHA